jgi:hypothetical protein
VNPVRPVLLTTLLVLVAACGGRTAIDEPLPSVLEATPGATASEPPPARTAPGPGYEVPPASEEPVSQAPVVTQTDTDWGRIWDALPASFPVYPGAVETEEFGGDNAAVSAAFTVAETGTDDIVIWMQQRLELATYSTEALSGPLEDDAFMIDSVGDAGCRIETTVKPAGGLTFIAVRYGADCPFD